MPRYHFNVHDGHTPPDFEGSLLDDLDAARREATRYAADLLVDEALREGLDGVWRMDVVCEGAVVFSLRFEVAGLRRSGPTPTLDRGEPLRQGRAAAYQMAAAP